MTSPSKPVAKMDLDVDKVIDEMNEINQFVMSRQAGMNEVDSSCKYFNQMVAACVLFHKYLQTYTPEEALKIQQAVMQVFNAAGARQMSEA